MNCTYPSRIPILSTTRYIDAVQSSHSHNSVLLPNFQEYDFEVARLHQNKIRDSKILRINWRVARQVRKNQEYHEKASKRPKHVWVNEPINIKNIRV